MMRHPLSPTRSLLAPSAPGQYGHVSSQTHRCLDVVLLDGSSAHCSAPATATVSACKALTAGIILVLLSCDWPQLVVCELVPSHTAPPAHLGKPSSIFNLQSSPRSPPQAFQAAMFGCYRPENFWQVCATGASGGHTISQPPGAYGWEYTSSRPPSPQATPTTPLPPCANTFTFHCMCTQHHTQKFALHTTATAGFAEFSSNLLCYHGTWVHWRGLHQYFHQYPPYHPPLSPSTTTYLGTFVGSADFTTFVTYDGFTSGRPFNLLPSPRACESNHVCSRDPRRNPNHFPPYPWPPRLVPSSISSNHL